MLGNYIATYSIDIATLIFLCYLIYNNNLLNQNRKVPFYFGSALTILIILAEAGGRGIDSGESAATMHLGSTGILHGCKTMLMQTEDGQITEPYSISAGLDYPGIGPIHAFLASVRRAEVVAINDDEALKAAFELTRYEGIIPALESAHALAALERVKFSPDDIVVLTLSGRGDKDLETYFKYEDNQF